MRSSVGRCRPAKVDLEVPSPLPYAGGKDPQLDAAVAALARQVGG